MSDMVDIINMFGSIAGSPLANYYKQIEAKEVQARANKEQAEANYVPATSQADIDYKNTLTGILPENLKVAQGELGVKQFQQQMALAKIRALIKSGDHDPDQYGFPSLSSAPGASQGQSSSNSLAGLPAVNDQQVQQINKISPTGSTPTYSSEEINKRLDPALKKIDAENAKKGVDFGGNKLSGAQEKQPTKPATLSGKKEDDFIPNDLDNYLEDLKNAKRELPLQANIGDKTADTRLKMAMDGTPAQKDAWKQSSKTIADYNEIYNTALNMVPLLRKYAEVLHTIPKDKYGKFDRMAGPAFNEKYGELQKLSTNISTFAEHLYSIPSAHRTDALRAALSSAYLHPDAPIGTLYRNLGDINESLMGHFISTLQLQKYRNKRGHALDFKRFDGDIKKVDPDIIKEVAPLLLSKKELTR